MAGMAVVENGKIVTSTSQESLANATTKSSSGMDKDSFLQLLVAQMKYQDPLQPTSNTEYVSQYAQFSQVEQVQNMASTMEMQRAGSLVGQQVYLNTTTASGDSQTIRGRVDYVVYQQGKAFLAINEELYSLSDLETVADPTYLEAFDKAMDLVNRLNQLPAPERVTLSDDEEISALSQIFEEMNDYQKSFVALEKQEALQTYITKMTELKKQQETDDTEESEPDIEIDEVG
ncbi:MAG: hypothetical protein LBM69_06020 [Lachnospiraceae bacterium]|jgi:flagellar basal-body rod modification protein FlgD|nr:hypothetical protein [Lachnospiraceae bacterium]